MLTSKLFTHFIALKKSFFKYSYKQFSTSIPIKPSNPFVVPALYPNVPIYNQRGWSSYIDKLKLSSPGLTEKINSLKSKGETLSFAWITPKSLHHGLEGGILARLLSTPDINLIATSMYAPSNNFVDDYVNAHSINGPFKPFIDFMNTDLRPNTNDNYSNHIMLLLFTGKNVRSRLIEVIGSQAGKFHVSNGSKTIRGSYGDVSTDKDGKVIRFQPAIVGAHSDEANERYLRVFSRYAFEDAGILKMPETENDQSYSNAMVIIKPDSLHSPSARPGHIMDLFSSTGLTLIGSSIFSMSVAQAREFYGFLEGVFEKKLAKDVEKILKSRLEDAFAFKVPEEVYTVTTALLRKQHAQYELSRIVSFMTGVLPPPGNHNHNTLSAIEQLKRGPAKCLALLYRGKDAIATVRSKLGSTDPSTALPGTVRFDYGDDVMKNGAHASDSTEALEREMKIINFGQGKGTTVKKIVDIWLHPDSSHDHHDSHEHHSPKL